MTVCISLKIQNIRRAVDRRRIWADIRRAGVLAEYFLAFLFSRAIFGVYNSAIFRRRKKKAQKNIRRRLWRPITSGLRAPDADAERSGAGGLELLKTFGFQPTGFKQSDASLDHCTLLKARRYHCT
jgi:hypothetical protein